MLFLLAKVSKMFLVKLWSILYNKFLYDLKYYSFIVYMIFLSLVKIYSLQAGPFPKYYHEKTAHGYSKRLFFWFFFWATDHWPFIQTKETAQRASQKDRNRDDPNSPHSERQPQTQPHETASLQVMLASCRATLSPPDKAWSNNLGRQPIDLSGIQLAFLFHSHLSSKLIPSLGLQQYYCPNKTFNIESLTKRKFRRR